jgi:hypothetical protein
MLHEKGNLLKCDEKRVLVLIASLPAALFNFLMIYITSRFLITTEAPSFYQAPSQRQIQLGSPTFKVQLAKRSERARCSCQRMGNIHPHFYVRNAELNACK